ncbi:hypothetical protein PR048_003504 [Dryococelus australis]|uniref:CCHC-type domain-containing protein n=1 Tax=Dryococelus australis TaxID=614101 RepID=A0ABQ9INA9_9NEOP|nr:hypothetical protein PR048_003504 [Dryococelus australis]
MDDYNDWKFTMKMLLLHEKLWTHATGEAYGAEKKLDPDNEIEALSLICLYVKLHLHPYMWNCTYIHIGLPEELRPLRMAVENSGIEVISELVRMKLLQEDLRRSISCGGNGEVVFVSKKKEGFTSRGAKNMIHCYRCNKLGHIKLNCPQQVNLVKEDMKSNTVSSRTAHSIGELSTNLLSVSKVVEKGLVVVFSHNNGKVQGNLEPSALNVGVLYKLDEYIPVAKDLQFSRGEFKCHNTVGAVFNSHKIIWNRRFRHLNRKGMCKLKNGLALGIKFSRGGDEPCVTCIEGKQCRKPVHDTSQCKSGLHQLSVLH